MKTLQEVLWCGIWFFLGATLAMIFCIKCTEDERVYDVEAHDKIEALQDSLNIMTAENAANYSVACNLNDIIKAHLDHEGYNVDDNDVDSMRLDFIVNYKEYNASLPSHLYEYLDATDSVSYQKALIHNFDYYYSWWY